MERKEADNTSSEQPAVSPSQSATHEEMPKPKENIGQRLIRNVKTPGSALQIVIAAILAIAIGLAVTSSVDDIPEAAPALIAIPGRLWLRALKAVVLPLIVTALILAVQRLRNMANGGHILARWTIGYYVLTTLFAVVISSIMVSQIWAGLMQVADEDSLEISDEDKDKYTENAVPVHDAVVQMFDSLVPDNVVNALATNSLLAVLVTSVVVGYLIKPENSSILRFVEEVEVMIMKIITFLIKIAPIGVFFLILPNLFKLPINEIGYNLGILIGGALTQMFLHLFVILPAIYFITTRKNPYTYWFSNSPAWITAWGTASSAATLSVTLKCARARGLPNTVSKFALPLGCLVNMDGTAIYFPICVVFLAATQGIQLSAINYVIICLLSTLASIGTTPIPSSSLVLTIIIAESVGVPLTGMYAVVVAIDWFLDRFRTAVNVSGDLFGAAVVTKLSKITDPDDGSMDGDVGEVRTSRPEDKV